MGITLGELRSCVRTDMMIDKNGRIWNDEVLDEQINYAISKLVSDLSHIQSYFEIELKETNQSTIEFFRIHKPCIIVYTSYLLFSMPSDQRNVEKATFKLQRYREELRTLMKKICKIH